MGAAALSSALPTSPPPSLLQTFLPLERGVKKRKTVYYVILFVFEYQIAPIKRSPRKGDFYPLTFVKLVFLTLYKEAPLTKCID